MDWLQFLRDAGPYSAPLCVGMSAAVGWLARQNHVVGRECAEARADASQLRDQRLEDLRAASTEYREQSITLAQVIGDSTRLIGEAIARMDGSGNECREHFHALQQLLSEFRTRSDEVLQTLRRLAK